MTALIRFLRELVAEPALLVAQVIEVNADNTSTVEFPGGSRARVRGTIVAVGSNAFVKDGVIQGLAPSGGFDVVEIG